MAMKIIDFETIRNLSISPADCVKWVETALRMKYDSCLPHKISMTIEPDVFSRFPKREPALVSDILLYDATNGDFLALMDGSWITAMRTGAVAALSIQYLRTSSAREYAFMGLGNTARATLLCLMAVLEGPLNIRLLSYKGQELEFTKRFKEYSRLNFSIFENVEDLITGADVVVSCVTVAHGQFASDTCFKPGVLVVPVHTRGFQNCDLFFDQVFADDVAHVEGFKYFNQFKQFDEFARILLKQNPGRTSDQERILAYNIGIALHDIYFASQVYDKVKDSLPDISSDKLSEKFWV